MADVFCNQHVNDYVQQDCGVERAGIIGMVLIDKTLAVTQSNLQDANWYSTFQNASPQRVFVIKDTRGEYNGGTAVKEDGFGKESMIVTGAEHTAAIEVQDIFDNRDFFESINRRKWKVGLCAVDLRLYYIDIPTSVDARMFNPKSIKALAFWKVTLDWSNFSNPLVYTAPDGVFAS